MMVLVIMAMLIHVTWTQIRLAMKRMVKVITAILVLMVEQSCDNPDDDDQQLTMMMVIMMMMMMMIT